MKNKSLVAGILVFVGILGAGVFVRNAINMYTSLPSKSEVVNFANDVVDQVPTVSEISGTFVPDTSTKTAAEGTVTDLGSSQVTTNTQASTGVDWLTSGQRKVLSTLGIDESSLPKQLTPELENCLNLKLGTDRVSAIKSGDTPTLTEGMKAMTCL